MLPSILKRAVILTAVCLAAAGVIAFYAGALQRHDGEERKLKIGYTAEADQLTALAVSYVQNIESVRSLCSLEPVGEQEGKQLLESGELSALIVLPEDVIGGILSGSNTPATLYLPGKQGKAATGGLGAAGSVLFEELVSTGMGMLGTAQAEIYASGAVLRELSAEYGAGMYGDDILQSMYDDINRFNLQTTARREKLFRTRTLSLTENDTYAVYYGSAIFTVYAMAAGLFFGKFCKRSSLQQTMADRRIGVRCAEQLAARCLAGSLLMLLVLLMPILTLAVPGADGVLTIGITWQGIVSLMLIAGFMTIYFMAVFQIVERQESALVVTGILAVLQAYLSGCLVPTVLLPKAAASIGGVLPAAMVKKGFTILFTGDTQSFSGVAAGLCAWGLCLFLGTTVSMYLGERDRTAADTRGAAVRIHVPSLGMVMFRRLLHRKSMWVSLGVIAVLSAVIVKAEQGSEMQIRAAVCDVSGEYTDLLEAYDGLVRFVRYESDEAVQGAVLRGDAECGYVLPETLAEDMISARADREIRVYQDADAVAVPVVNEILFERIFRRVSLEWFEDYIAQSGALKVPDHGGGRLREIARSCFDRELLEGSTFHFEIRRMETADTAAGYDGSETDGQRRSVYPAYLVAVTAVVLCALQGILQVASDVRAQNFYKRNRLQVSVLTFILPLMMGVLCAVLIIAAAG